MSRRIFSLTFAVAIILLAAVPARTQEDKVAKINQYVDQFLAMIPKDYELMRKVQLIKDADLTYQNSLTVSVSDVLDCKNKGEMRLLLGMYIFDSNYAMLFDKRKELQESWEFGFHSAMEKLALQGEAGVAMFPAADLKTIIEDPTNPEHRLILIRDINSQVEAILKQAREKPEFLEVVVDEFYGTIIEGLYVICNLALNEDLSGTKMVALFNGLQQSLGGYAKVEAIFAGDEYFEGMIKKGERAKVLNPINTLLETSGGKLKVEDMKKILSIIEPVRSQVVRKCK